MESVAVLRCVAVGHRILDQGLDRDHADHLGAAGSCVVRPGRRVDHLLAAARRPPIQGVRTAAVGEAGAPEIDVRTGQVGIHLVPRAGRLADVVQPDIPAVGVAGGIVAGGGPGGHGSGHREAETPGQHQGCSGGPGAAGERAGH